MGRISTVIGARSLPTDSLRPNFLNGRSVNLSDDSGGSSAPVGAGRDCPDSTNGPKSLMERRLLNLCYFCYFSKQVAIPKYLQRMSDRGSKPGEYRGGRQNGTKNKATRARDAHLAAVQVRHAVFLVKDG
jgi:hypothetical protein